MQSRHLLIGLLFTAPLLADPAHYKSIVAVFTIAADGTAHVEEQADIEVPAGSDVIERMYWSDDEQRVRFERVTGPGGEVPFESGQRPASIAWHGGSGRYVIESTIENAVIPVWSIPRAAVLTRDDARLVQDPRQRLREILPIWKQAPGHWRTRVLADFQYEMPPPSEQGTDIRFELYWPRRWDPAETIMPDTLARRTPFDTFNSTRWRVMHLFDAEESPMIGARQHAMRMAAIAGFPIVSLLLWILFVIREVWRRGIMSGDDDVNERVLFDEPAEVIATRWRGIPKVPTDEAFIRGLEKRRKVATTEDGLRLLVTRDTLTPYERAGVEALMSHQAAQGTLHVELTKIAEESNGPKKSPWWSQLTSFAIFAAGIGLLIVDLKKEPLLLFAALVISSTFTGMWPDGFTRVLLRTNLWPVLIPLLAIVAATAAVLAVNLAPQAPLGVYGAAGFSLVMLAVVKAGLAASATREPRAALQKRSQLAQIRRKLRADPHVREDLAPYLEALALR